MAYDFRLTRDRSQANVKYEFDFIGNSRLAIVPVLHRFANGYRIIGTASYFIRPNIFLTVGHLFEGDDIQPNDSFYLICESSIDWPLEIIEIIKHETLDLAFLVLENDGEQYFNDVNPLAVMNLPPLKNEIVAVFGYSHSLVNPEEAIEQEGEFVQPMRIRSKWELGGVLDISENGRGNVNGQCFETSILAEGRDSGAPMFNSNGFLVGLLSTSFNFETGLPNSTCVSVLNLSELTINGTPVKELWFKKNRAAYCKLKKNDDPE